MNLTPSVAAPASKVTPSAPTTAVSAASRVALPATTTAVSASRVAPSAAVSVMPVESEVTPVVVHRSAVAFLREERLLATLPKSLPDVPANLSIDMGESPAYGRHIDIEKIFAGDKTPTGKESYSVNELQSICQTLLKVLVNPGQHKADIVRIMLSEKNVRMIERNNRLLVRQNNATTRMAPRRRGFETSAPSVSDEPSAVMPINLKKPVRATVKTFGGGRRTKARVDKDDDEILRI